MIWTTYEYPGALTNEQRTAWYHEIGIDAYFDITVDTRDWLRSKTTSGSYVRFGFENMRNAYTDSSKPCFYVPFAYSGGSTVWGNMYQTDFAPTNSNAPQIYFDKYENDDVVLWRIRYSDMKAMYLVAVSKSGTNVDGDSESVYIYGAQTNSNNEPVDAFHYFGISNNENTITAENHSTPYWYTAGYNVGHTNNYIIQPLYIGRCKSGLYSVDGGSNRISNFNIIGIGSNVFMSIGHGIAVKVS